jgi:solute carrier family 26, other
VAVDSIAITIVSYTINVSMAFIFAKRQNYEINANQEFFALGVSNVVGANFACLPNACALSRSIIQEQTGGKTQVAGVVTSALILIVLLWIGPFFEPLPKCVLAGIIIMAIKGMLAQLFELKKVVKEGIFETVIWLGTFLAVVILDMDLGLLVGVVISLFALYIKGWKSYYCLVGTLPETGMYVDISTHRAAVEVANVKIFRYSGAVNFSTRTGFKKAFYETIGSELEARKLVLEEEQKRELELITSKVTPIDGLHTVIVDLSFILHLDVAGVKCLDDIRQDISGRLGIDLLLAAPCDRVYDALLKATAYDVDTFEVFSTVHDAVLNGLKK